MSFVAFGQQGKVIKLQVIDKDLNAYTHKNLFVLETVDNKAVDFNVLKKKLSVIKGIRPFNPNDNDPTSRISIVMDENMLLNDNKDVLAVFSQSGYQIVNLSIGK